MRNRKSKHLFSFLLVRQFKHPDALMPEEYLPLTSRGRGVRVWVGFAQFEVSLDVNQGAFIQSLEVLILGGIEGGDLMPCGCAFHPSAIGVRRWRGVVGCCDGV